MPSRQSVEELRASNAGIVNLIDRDLRSFWDTLNLASPEAARDALLVVVPELVAKYGDIAATVAADWYEEQRSEARVRGPYRAVTADLVPSDAIEQSVRRTSGYLFGDTPEMTIEALALLAGKYAVQPGRSTISLNAGREHVRWARVPTGRETCAFCLTMASRGFVYLNAERAGLHDKYHGKCDCVPTPDWSEEPHLEGYDPSALYSQYLDARQTSGSGDLNEILATLREQEGIH